jgi:hypothetical protein
MAWTYKVVERARGERGEFFPMGTCGTYSSYDEALADAIGMRDKKMAVLGEADSRYWAVLPRRKGQKSATLRMRAGALSERDGD